VKDFIRQLLGKISNAPKLARYEYMLFDCPPSFTLLSYSVLSCCDLVLIPVNPDYFASRGVSLILNSLRLRIEPHPIPKIGVFMNKAKAQPNPTKETRFYMREVERVCQETAKQQKINARFFKSYVRERVGIKRAITGGGVPADFVADFQNLWKESVAFLNE
jgi:cellulose biosynthesis protein BcsQ